MSWGWKIGLLYTGFAAMIITLVVMSTRQHFDLVTKDYYKAEIKYQEVIDAAKNQSTLSRPFGIHANSANVVVDFPAEFSGKAISGKIQFYSPANADWDHTVDIAATDNKVMIARADLKPTNYTIKIRCTVDGREYYQESSLQLAGL